MKDEILEAIPHRPPFLFVDKIVSISDSQITTEKEVKADESFFKGHYPGNPLMPGVLVCESVFQSAAILISKKMSGSERGGVPVLTRINEAKFKNMVLPGNTLEIQVDIIEKMGSAYFLKGVARTNGKVAVRVEFAVTLASSDKTKG